MSLISDGLWTRYGDVALNPAAWPEHSHSLPALRPSLLRILFAGGALADERQRDDSNDEQGDNSKRREEHPRGRT